MEVVLGRVGRSDKPRERFGLCNVLHSAHVKRASIDEFRASRILTQLAEATALDVDLRYAPVVERDLTARTPDTMTVSERLVGDVVVLMVVGRMTVETRESILTRAVKSRLADDSRGFVVNLGEVPYCVTRGLAELILSLTMVERNEGTLKLARVQPRVMTLLKTNGLLGVFEMFDTEREALASFGSISD